MRLKLTDHAVDRYIQRCAPHLTHEDARAQLAAGLDSAAQLRDRTLRGQARWRLDEPPCILITRPAREGGEHLVVTVLPDAEPEQDALQALQVLLELHAANGIEIRRVEKTPRRQRGPQELQHLHLEQTRLKADIEAARMDRVREMERARQLKAEQRRAFEAEKTARHQANRNSEIERLKNSLRIAVSGLVSGNIDAALNALRQTAPWAIDEALRARGEFDAA